MRLLPRLRTPDGWRVDPGKFSWLRAVEWASWPAFVSQPVIPVLYLIYPWWAVLLTVAALTLVWSRFCTRFANLELAMYGVLFTRAKWFTIPAACVLLVLRHHPVLAVLALVTPVAAGLLGPMAAVGPIEALFYEQMGLVSADEEGKASANSDAPVEIRDEDIPF